MRDTDRRVTMACLILLLVGAVIGIAVPAGPGWDFANFYDTGARVAAGQLRDIYDPSTPIRGASPQGTMAFWGTPLSAIFYTPMAWLAPGAALVLFKIQNTLAYFAALLLLYVHTRRFAGDSPDAQSRFGALFAFLALIYQPFWTVYRVGGQTTPTIVFLLTVGLLTHTANKRLWTVLCLVTTVLIKPAFLPILGILMLVSGARFFRDATLVGSVLALTSVAVLGWPIHREFLAVLARGAINSFPWFYNSSLYVWFDALRVIFPAGPAGAPSPVITAVVTGAKVCVLLLAVLVFVRSRTQVWVPAARRHFDFLIAVSFCLLLSQTVWEHYLAVLFLPLAYLVAVRHHLSRSAVWLIWAIFFLSIWQNLIIVNVLRDSFRWESFVALLAVGLLKSGPLLLFLILLVRHSSEIYATYTLPPWAAAVAVPAASVLGAVPAGARTR